MNKKLVSWGSNLIILGLVIRVIVFIIGAVIYGWHWEVIMPWEQDGENLGRWLTAVGLTMIALGIAFHVIPQIEAEEVKSKEPSEPDSLIK